MLTPNQEVDAGSPSAGCVGVAHLHSPPGAPVVAESSGLATDTVVLCDSLSLCARRGRAQPSPDVRVPERARWELCGVE